MRKLLKNYKFLLLSFIIAPFLIIINLIQAVAQEGDKTVSQYQSYTPQNQEWGRIISLDGQWEVEEGNKQQIPSKFSATVPVPGLITSATPAFKNAGEEKSGDAAFWYRRKFNIAGNIPELVRLKIFKSMFGTKVFINGKEVGESPLNFTPLYFNVTPFLKGNSDENEIIIRVGAHISSVPDSVVSGADPERQKYPSGIYDHVQLLFSSDSYVARTQVVPDIEAKSIKTLVYFAANKKSGQSLDLNATVLETKTGKQVGRAIIKSGAISAGKESIITVNIPIKDCKLWTPEEPNLYVLRLSNKDYSYQTRFGMRNFTVDSSYTNKALLNNEPCFLRGTNFSIHRFFEDPLSKQYAWDPVWVRQLFRTFTAMDMNAVRFVIGPGPEMWYDIADEEGMMIFDEYAIWYAYQPDIGSVEEQAADPFKKWGIWPKNLTSKQLIREYTDWMQEHWNHPSIIVWDAQNESWSKETGKAIKEVRKLDLSNRVWDNGWSPPVSAGDIREAHPYFERWVQGSEMKTPDGLEEKPFSLANLATAEKIPSTFYLPYQYAYNLPPNWYWKQPCVINEYSYLWLNRDGTPTSLTKPYYDAVLGINASPDKRRELYARNLAAVTEYWRATRSCFGILYPFGLAASIPGGATNDNFINIANLELDQYYKKYVPDAFSALGICAELWKTDFEIEPWSGTQAEFAVAVINDMGISFNDYFNIIITKEDSVIQTQRYRYEVLPYEVSRRHVKIELPDKPGKYEIIAELHGRENKIVRSYRPIQLHRKQN
jgi:beta-galactosidase/beta-glucuronidase